MDENKVETMGRLILRSFLWSKNCACI